MFYIVETVQQLQSLEIYKNKPCFIEPIPYSDKVHPKLGQICAFYYRPLVVSKGFILPINHLETLSLDLQAVLAFLESLEAEIWTIDKKVALHYGLGNLPLKGLKMAYSLIGSKEFPDIYSFDTPAHRFYQRKLRKRLDYNRFIPISKHFEKYENFFEKLEIFDEIPGFEFYNTIVVENFYKIEDNGIGIDQEVFDSLYKTYPKEINIFEGKIYTEFLFFNNTARPTCKFDRINFLGLKKEGNSRKFMVPGNSIFIEFDYRSYQVKLMSDLLGFKFHGNIHEALAKQYYNTDIISEEQYQSAKLTTFQFIYGRHPHYNGDIPFYQAIYDFRDRLWGEYQINGFITSPVSGRRIYNIEEVTQMLPLLMQCIETERNALIIDKLHQFLKKYETKIVLYTYDAFLFDVSRNDGSDMMQEIESIIESEDFETTIKYGNNYSELATFNPS